MYRSVVERALVALLSASLVLGGVLGVLTVREFNRVGLGQVVAGTGVGTASGADTVAGDSSGMAGGDASGGGAAGGSTDASGGSAGASGGSTSVSGLANNQAASGVSKDKIVVGGIFDMTGPVDSSVERDTVRAYFAKVNAAGGINGRKLQMLDCDSQYDTTAAHRCALNMVNQHVLAIVGMTAPKGEDNEVQTFTGAKIPVIGGLGTPNEYTDPLSFPVSASFSHYGLEEGKQAATLGFKHSAVVVVSDVPWFAPVEKTLLDSLKANGDQPTDVEEVQSTQGDYTGTVVNLMNKGCTTQRYGSGTGPSQACPDSLIAAMDPFSYNRLFQAMARSNWHPPLLGAGLDKGSVQAAYNSTGELAGAHSLVPFLSPYDHPDNPTVADYESTVKTYYPAQYTALDIYTEHSWTAAMIFVEALRRAGDNVTRQTLVDALNSIQNFDTGWSVPLSYGPGNHDPNRCFTYVHNVGGTTWKTDTGWQCV